MQSKYGSCRCRAGGPSTKAKEQPATETAAINAVLTYSHAFHADLRKPVRWLAPDHGTPPRENRGPLPAIWVRHHAEYFRDTKLRPRPTDPAREYADRDLFAEMIEPARRRGMKVYARILESSGASIEGPSLFLNQPRRGSRFALGFASLAAHRCARASAFKLGYSSLVVFNPLFDSTQRR